jgi:hypothetical protein
VASIPSHSRSNLLRDETEAPRLAAKVCRFLVANTPIEAVLPSRSVYKPFAINDLVFGSFHGLAAIEALRIRQFKANQMRGGSSLLIVLARFSF